MTTAPANTEQATKEKVPPFELGATPHFVQWLASTRSSIAFTTYQAGRIFLLGIQDNGRLDIYNRAFPRCMGLYASSNVLYLSSEYQLWRFQNVLQPGQIHKGYDRVYVPQKSYTTGAMDIHDISVDASGKPVFINTLFSCLATVSEEYSFVPIWKPHFITDLLAEDRCHLNGLAMKDNKPAFVTAIAKSNESRGWREKRQAGGIVMSVENNEIVLDGLSMPHSPRWKNDRLWLINSGTGEFGYCDLERGRFEPVAFVPGYGRGLTFIGNYAVVGLSKPRHENFSGLALDDKLSDLKIEAQCGLQIINLTTGEIEHQVSVKGAVSELYDVALLEGIRHPMAVGLLGDEIKQMISIPPGLDI